MTFYYTEAANKNVFGRKFVHNKKAKSWKNVYAGVHKVHGNIELFSRYFL